MSLANVSIVIFSDADPGGCVRLLTSCERLEHEGFDFEVILVLQGLTDKVERMLKDYPFSFDVSFIKAPVAANRAVGRNLGVAQARHDIVLLLDSDLELTPELLEQHLEPFTDPGVLAVMGEIFIPKFVKKSRWYRFLDSDYLNTRRWSKRADASTTPPLRYVRTSNFSLRRAAFMACEGYCETIEHHEAEDIDLAHRLSALDQGALVFQPEAIAYSQQAALKPSLVSKFEFGREGIPKLLTKYPDLYPVLSSRFVRIQDFPPVSWVYRTFMSLLFTPPVLFMARAVRILGPQFIAFRMMRYMLQYESIRGLKASLKHGLYLPAHE